MAITDYKEDILSMLSKLTSYSKNAQNFKLRALIRCKALLQTRGSETQDNSHIPNSKYTVNGSVSQAMTPLVLFRFPLLWLPGEFTRAHCQFRTWLEIFQYKIKAIYSSEET